MNKTIVIALLGGGLLSGWAQMMNQRALATTAPATTEQTGLVFQVEATKPVYIKGEPVELNFRLSNQSKSIMLVAKSFQLNYYVELNIANAGGHSAVWCGRIVDQIDSPRSFVKLSPGQSIHAKLVVSCVNGNDPKHAWGYLVQEPGKYSVKATYRLPQTKRFLKSLFPGIVAVKGPISAPTISLEIR
jgi:hypothetical protein